MYEYRKMFEDLEPFYPRRDDLKNLALIMSGSRSLSDIGSVGPVSGASPPTIPAGYTYLGQFITHDISFDQQTDSHRREDFPDDIIDRKCLRELRNLRNPTLDMEVIYGRENPTNPIEIRRSQLMLPTSDEQPFPFLRLGVTKNGKGFPNDLLRGSASVNARIIDPRNDENLLVAQTQVAFIKFHNALVMEFGKDTVFEKSTWEEQSAQLFVKARRAAIRYYQTIILKDFLPRIVQDSVLNEVLETAKTTKAEPGELFMPLEFSVAAFRFGHSMIKEKYDLNKHNHIAELLNLTTFTGRGEMDSKLPPLAASRISLPNSWIINWNLFYEIDGVPSKNDAEAINTDLPKVLLKLPSAPAESAVGVPPSLAALDLYRGRKFGLPTGQDVAAAIGTKEPLSPDRIGGLIERRIISDAPQDEIDRIKKRLTDVFSETTPLWFYILAEAEIQTDDEIKNGPPFKNAGKLGAVGSRIVAETIIKLLKNSEYSVLEYPMWESDEDRLLQNGEFNMSAMLKFIQQTCIEHHERLYPIQFYPSTEGRLFDELDPLEKGYQ